MGWVVAVVATAGSFMCGMASEVRAASSCSAEHADLAKPRAGASMMQTKMVRAQAKEHVSLTWDDDMGAYAREKVKGDQLNVPAEAVHADDDEQLIADEMHAAHADDEDQIIADEMNAAQEDQPDVVAHVDCDRIGDGEGFCGLEMLRGVAVNDAASVHTDIKERISAECLKKYTRGMCEGIADSLFVGVDTSEAVTESECKEVRDLVGAHWCHVTSQKAREALLQRSASSSTVEEDSVDTALSKKGNDGVGKFFSGFTPDGNSDWFYIKNRETGGCISPIWPGGNGEQVLVLHCHVQGLSHMTHWRWLNSRVLQNRLSMRCLDFPSWSSDKVTLWDCDKTGFNKNQFFSEIMPITHWQISLADRNPDVYGKNGHNQCLSQSGVKAIAKTCESSNNVWTWRAPPKIDTWEIPFV